MVDGEALSHGATHGMAHDNGLLQTYCVHERGEVRSEIGEPVAGRRATRVAMTSLRQRERVDGLGEMRKHELEGTPGISEAVQEHHGYARCVSLFNVPNPHLVRKLSRQRNEAHGCGRS